MGLENGKRWLLDVSWVSIKRRLFKEIIRTLDFVWPKKKNLLLFGSHGTRYIGGNSKVMFDYIRQLESQPFDCYYLTANPPKGEEYLNRISLRSIRLFLRAKTILLTHGLGDMGILRPSQRKNVIYLWHGQGPKADGYASRRWKEDKLRELEKTMIKATAFLTCSRLDSYIRAYGHTLHPRQILPLGFPRCDFLTSGEDRESILPRILDDLPPHNKVALYAITWRNEGDARFFPFDDFDTELLEEWCKDNRILLLIRPHVNETTVIEESKFVRFVPFDLLIDVIELLLEVDILITDYSSIQSDFLLLDRPIIYVPYDLEDFKVQEGFCLPDFNFWAPGEKVLSFSEFMNSIQQITLGNDTFSDQRRRVNLIVNEYQTPGASDRVYKYLRSLLGKTTLELSNMSED
jgi:CDP-glycerol glycerophosphotransferase (TagB/SpsB family)